MVDGLFRMDEMNEGDRKKVLKNEASLSKAQQVMTASRKRQISTLATIIPT
jgi:hypothetical protein